MATASDLPIDGDESGGDPAATADRGKSARAGSRSLDGEGGRRGRARADEPGSWAAEVEEEGDGERKEKEKGGDVMGLFDAKFKCSFCMQLPERPVTTPCGHNFCLKCFQKWIGQGKRTCAQCRAPIPQKMASQPRINSALVVAIRMAKTQKPASQCGSTPAYHFIGNENRPETAFTTERAKKAGKANACSGQIFVTIAPDHFGPILAEHDPKRKRGVLVGESWEDRMECRQWGAHFPHVAGIAGQSTYGAQSVALSGGYQDDEDHGEWFLYTGSGGRDLSGNKRTNKDQSFDQKFVKLNEALRISCKNGYPVRVVRSHKEKRSSYAPETGVRYDGIYRIEKCWRKVGIQGFKVCRYLFVRCDNEPAPWTSDEQGDRPRPLPAIKELKQATDITMRKGKAAWDYEEGCRWKWTRPPPSSRKISTTESTGERKRRRNGPSTIKEKLLKEFSCLICCKVMSLPLTTPCAHNFCKPCLLDSYADQSFLRERTHGGRTLRTQKVVKKCPSCPNDISDFLQNPQVNREVMDLIESLQKKNEDENIEGSTEEGSDVVQKSGGDDSDVEKDEVETNDKEEIGSGDVKEDETGSDDKLIEEGSDGVVAKEKKLEPANGDSEIHAANSEMDESGEDCQSPAKKTNTQATRKRKQITSTKRFGKKAKKNEDVGSVDSGGDQKWKNQNQANGSSHLSPSNQNRRVTQQMKLKGEL
ncbi:uncharacterized protein A4U43_C10F3670 [Asparagus officinalis]|uniref:RING-type E3 ubiquitin transferase n=1 Tax=Asparagus officinalis TaxID=4686 RepID=A0A5P1E0F1_ASPOF|nr:E3 ubiquitin-protein ligase ORTHRUS 2-like [Asparagus officinalis]ONK56054.1 uncharacterized protein A4U43_C10F3670 [Asparagus officinalis]